MYDNNGDAFGFTYNGKEYYYIKNAQNDVTAIADSSGKVIANYHYDAWGKVLEVTGTNTDIANANPIRYRSYYYDSDTELYYLNTRYYSPDMCRFINADGYVQTGQDILDKNMLAFCLNNPINRIDSNGTVSEFVLGGLAAKFAAMLPMILIVATLVVCCYALTQPQVMQGIQSAINSISNTRGNTSTKSSEKAKTKGKTIEKAKTKDAATSKPNPTVIYRYGGTNPGNLTPKPKDLSSGLSFSTIPMPGAAMTTIEAINATGVVYAVKDGPTHVSVRPVGGTMQDWICAGSNSIWTQSVRSVVIKWDGVD